MNANELRLGNLMNYYGNDVMVMAISKGSADFGYFTDSIGFTRHYDVDFPKPIPLTEEWLVKFGLVQTIIGFEFSNEYFPFSIEINSLGLAELQMEFYGGGQYKKIIKHVHQLQNLYFALTGNELHAKPH